MEVGVDDSVTAVFPKNRWRWLASGWPGKTIGSLKSNLAKPQSSLNAPTSSPGVIATVAAWTRAVEKPGKATDTSGRVMDGPVSGLAGWAGMTEPSYQQ